MSDIRQWLEELGLSQYAELAFRVAFVLADDAVQ